MYGDYCFGSGSDRASDCFCRDVLTLGINVNANRTGSAHDYTTGGRDEGAWSGDDLMPTSDAERLQRQLECNCPIRQANGMFCANRLREFRFKQTAFLAGPVIDLPGA